MEKIAENIVCINKNIFNKIRLIIKDTSDLFIDESSDNYLIEKSIYENIIKRFNNLLNMAQRYDIKSIKGASLSRFNDIKNQYEMIKYNYIRNEFNKLKEAKLDEEKILELKIKLYEEIDNIQKIPFLINSISTLIKEIQSNNLSENINSYMINFKSFINNGALYEDYINLKSELEFVIKKTYIKNINAQVYDNKNVYLVKNEGKVRILDTANLNDFTYGYIYSPSAIVRVTDKNNNEFVSFNNIEYDSYDIELDDSFPIGVYAVTYGEGEINPNYKKAESIYYPTSYPFIELDKVMLMNESDYSINELIDNLLVDRGLGNLLNDNDNETLYKSYEPFFEEFKKLKLKNHDISSIITLFNTYHNYIHSQIYLDLDKTLSDSLSDDAVKYIFENNKYFDFNIFRYERINEQIIKKFVGKIYKYKDNEKLERIYPGTRKVLEILKNASKTRIDEIINIYNKVRSTCKDTYLFSYEIGAKPKKIINEKAVVNQLGATIPEVRNDEYEYQDYLRSFTTSNRFAR